MRRFTAGSRQSSTSCCRSSSSGSLPATVASPQEGGEYQSMFEQEYWTIDPSQTAAEVHRQVRAWSFIPPISPDLGPILDQGGERVRVTRTSRTEVAGATRFECADGPLWIVESVPVQLGAPDPSFR